MLILQEQRQLNALGQMVKDVVWSHLKLPIHLI